MLKGVNLNNLNNFYDFAEHPFTGLNITPTQYDNIDDEIYGSDEFRMYAYKIKRCTRARSHDWTECPFAHRGEKATRRDPRKVPYLAISCPLFRNGKCHKGDSCEYAHGVFEYWLHPSRYRTRACNAGPFCQRKVCFFAHTPEQLRSEKKYMRQFAYRPRIIGGDGILGCGSGGGDEGGGDAIPATSMPVFGSPLRIDGGSYFDGVSQFLNSLRNLKISSDGGDHHHRRQEGEKSGGNGETESDLPHIDWISELVK